MQGGRSREEENVQRELQLPRFEKPTRSPRFEVNDDAAYEYLDENGYVVIAGALDAEELKIAIELFWEFVELSSDGHIQRNAPQTWANETWIGSEQNGLFEQHGIGQSAFLWHVRQRPKVLKAFQRVWSLDSPSDLVMSFDGCCAFRPTNVDATWRTLGGWYHVDQNGKTTGCRRNCVQGFVTIFDQDSTTGGLSVLPGSHKRIAELFNHWSCGDHHRDFCILEQNEKLLTGSGAINPRLVHARAGDLVLWDSRCIHCNVPAWHRFDERSIMDALAAAGLHESALQYAPELYCSDGSISSAIWAWHNAGLSSWPMDEQIRCLLSGLADELAHDMANAETTRPQGCLLRLVAYVCALPRSRASPSNLKDKRRAVLLGATATHWPDRAELKSIAPQSPAIIDAGVLSPVALKLLGCVGKDKDADIHSLQDELDQLYAESREHQ